MGVFLTLSAGCLFGISELWLFFPSALGAEAEGGLSPGGVMRIMYIGMAVLLALSVVCLCLLAATRIIKKCPYRPSVVLAGGCTAVLGAQCLFVSPGYTEALSAETVGFLPGFLSDIAAAALSNAAEIALIFTAAALFLMIVDKEFN